MAQYIICPGCGKPSPYDGKKFVCTRCAGSTQGGRIVSEQEAQPLMRAAATQDKAKK